MKEKRTSYSKILPIITGLLFAVTLYFGFTLTKTSVQDTAFLVTATTVAGGIFGTTCTWYMKKSQAENTVKLKSAVYKTIADTKIDYLQKALELKHKYNEDVTIDTEVEDDLDDAETQAESDLTSAADESMLEATASIEKEIY